MKLRSSKAAMYAGVGMVMGLIPVLPVAADAQTTYEQQQSTILESNNTIQASYTANVSDIVAAGYEGNNETGIFSNKALSITGPYIDIYALNNENSEVVGRLYENSIVDTIEVGKEWTKLTSGNVTGFVRTKTLCFNEEAEIIAAENGGVHADVISDIADVYVQADTKSAVIYNAANNESFMVAGYNGDYTAVVLADGTTGYIPSALVSVDYGFASAYTIAEAQAKEEAERIAAEEAEAARIAAEQEAARIAEEEAQKAAQANATVTYNSGMSVTDEELLILSTVIDWEAGWESYEGKLAVANVVLNRVRSGAYGDSIKAVVYAPYQFSGVTDGAGNVSSTFAARLAAGPRTAECTQAALDALSGVNNIGSYTSFRGLSIANYSSYSSYMIIGNHCFF